MTVESFLHFSALGVIISVYQSIPKNRKKILHIVL